MFSKMMLIRISFFLAYVSSVLAVLGSENFKPLVIDVCVSCLKEDALFCDKESICSRCSWIPLCRECVSNVIAYSDSCPFCKKELGLDMVIMNMKHIFGIGPPSTTFLSRELIQKTTYDDLFRVSPFISAPRPDWKIAFPFPGFKYAFPDGRHACFNWYHKLHGAPNNLIADCSIEGWEKMCRADLYCWGVTPETMGQTVTQSWRYPAVLLGIGRCIAVVEQHAQQLRPLVTETLSGFYAASGVSERDFVSDFLYWVHGQTRMMITQHQAVMILNRLVIALDCVCPSNGWHWVNIDRWNMLKQWISARAVAFSHKM